MCANRILDSSAAFRASLGRTKHCGTRVQEEAGAHPRVRPVSLTYGGAMTESGRAVNGAGTVHRPTGETRTH